MTHNGRLLSSFEDGHLCPPSTRPGDGKRVDFADSPENVFNLSLYVESNDLYAILSFSLVHCLRRLPVVATKLDIRPPTRGRSLAIVIHTLLAIASPPVLVTTLTHTISTSLSGRPLPPRSLHPTFGMTQPPPYPLPLSTRLVHNFDSSRFNRGGDCSFIRQRQRRVPP